MSDRYIRNNRRQLGILDWDDPSLLQEWEKLGNKGIKDGLGSGCSDDRIAEIRSLLHSQRIDRKMLPRLSGIKERDVFFANVGLGGKSTVKTLDLHSCSLTGNEVGNLCVNLSSHANKIESLNLSRTKSPSRAESVGTVSGCKLLGKALKNHSSLQCLKLGSVNMKGDAVEFLLNLLEGNKTLVSLDLSENPLKDKGIISVAKFLTKNLTLKRLDIHSTECGHEGARQLSSALEQNTTLEELVFGDVLMGNEGLTTLLKQLSGKTTLKILHLTEGAISKLEEVAQMIRKNKTLSTLRLGPASEREEMVHTPDPESSHGIAGPVSVPSTSRSPAGSPTLTLGSSSHFDSHAMVIPPDYWKHQFFPAVKENRALRELHLNQCEGLSGEDVKNALLDLAGSGTLEKISLSGSELEEELKPLLDEELRLNRICRDVSPSLPREQTTSGRLVLCSSESACPAKTAIRKSMKRLESNGGLPNSLNPARWMEARKKPRKTLGVGLHVVRLKKQKISISTTKEPYLKAIWDFEGGRKFYAMHDSLLQNSCFLYVCSCRHLQDPQSSDDVERSQEAMKLEFENWMKLIASISKPLTQQRPHVRFVLTCSKDTSNSKVQWVDWAKSVVEPLKETFKEVVELCETVEVVNADKHKHVKQLRSLTNNTLNILALGTNETICEELRHVMVKLPGCIPVMSMKHFSSMHLGSVNFSEVDSSIQKALLAGLLAYLKDLGDIVYLKDHFRNIVGLEEFDFIVTDPRWFGVHVLGSILKMFFGDNFSQNIEHSNGYVDRTVMKNFLNCSVKDFLDLSSQYKDFQTVLGERDLIKVMLCWELCFEKEPGNECSSLFVPAVFCDNEHWAAEGERQLKWEWESQTGELYSCFGRRLECAKKDVTYLTPGFFPRLQVHLGNYIQKEKWENNPGFIVDKNLISFSVPAKGIEVKVQYSGDESYFVDILVRSDVDRSPEALTFIQEQVVQKIQSFCASPQGCQGVTLKETVIIKEDVRDLQLFKKRRMQDED